MSDIVEPIWCQCGNAAQFVVTPRRKEDVTDEPLGYVECVACGFRTGGRQARYVAVPEWNRFMERPASTITALREEVERLTRTVNQYAYERDKAREERDQAERRSEQFWRGQLTALRQRVVEVGGAIVARVHERQTLLPTSAPVRALATLVNEMETTK